MPGTSKRRIHLFFDEPTSAIDEKLSEQIMEKYKNIPQNKITIVISHDPKSIKYATRVLELTRNKMNQTLIKDVKNYK